MATRGDPSVNELGKEICKIIGLPTEDVYSINISLKAGGIATVTIGQYIRETDTKKIRDVIAKGYKIIPLEGEKNE